MQSKIIVPFSLILVALLFLIACTKKLSDDKNGKLKAAVTSITYADFVKRVGGNRIDISILVPAGVDPHDFEPSFNRVKEISEADLYFRVGEIFSIENNWINSIRSNNNNIEVVDCSNGIATINSNPHVWLGLDEAKIIAENIYKALSKFNPEEEEYFKKNINSFIAKIDSMDQQIARGIGRLKHKKMLVYHPAWEYLLSRYGIEEISIEREGKEPKARDLREVIDYAKVNNIKSIFVEPQFDVKSAKAIADEIGAEIITINPLPEDYIENLSDVYSKIIKYLK